MSVTPALYDYGELTVAAGRPSKANSQWGVMMATWGAEYGGPLRADQVANVAAYVELGSQRAPTDG